MKKLFALVLALACLSSLLAGCSRYRPVEVENVSMRVTDVTPTGATVIIQDTNSDPHTYGEWYVIETQQNGKWVEVESIVTDVIYNSIGKTPAYRDVTFELDWEWRYGALPAGTYRLLKQVDNQYIAAIFEVEATAPEGRRLPDPRPSYEGEKEVRSQGRSSRSSVLQALIFQRLFGKDHSTRFGGCCFFRRGGLRSPAGERSSPLRKRAVQFVKNPAVLFTFWEFYGIITLDRCLIDKLEFGGDI